MVIKGLKGRPVSELCNEHQIGQSMCYKWRDQFLANARKVFQVEKTDQRSERLVDENRRLKGVIGDLTLEIKKRLVSPTRARSAGVAQALTSYNNPKGNADTERRKRTLKEELLWLSEWRSPSEPADQLASWILTFNGSYLHSSL